MKECVKCLMAALVAIIGVTANADWTFKPEVGTLPDGKTGFVGTVTDGVVTFHVTEVTGNENNQLTINAQYGSFNDQNAIPEKFSINFSEIYDAQKTTRYYAVKFGNFSYQAGCNFKDYAHLLTEFIAPDLTEIFGTGCFGNCINLTKVKLSDGFTRFSNDRPFIGCKSLVDFEPKELNITSIRIEAFSGCAKLAGEFSFPVCTGYSGGGKWFSGCEEIESIKMPLMTSIPGQSFSGCKKLKYVEFSKEISEISSTVFSGCVSLPGDCIRAMLNPGITKLGNDYKDIKNIFLNCSSFDGALEWNFPNLKTIKVKEDGVFVDKPANIVGEAFFSGCTKLNQVNFVTPVVEIRESAFANIAPGAELYMPLAVPGVFGAQAVGNKTGGLYPRVYLQGNYEEWLAKMEENHYVVRKEKFNTWSGEYSGTTRTWEHVAKMMESDNEMCTVVGNKVSLNQGVRGVLAFVLKKSNDGQVSSLYGFWVLKVPEKGLKVIVR